MAVKYSRQREAVREYLKSTYEHPTAEIVYENLRKTNPKISLGTVYRNLTFLVEQGEAIKVIGADGYDHFDAKTTPHYHFICRKCNSIIDMDMPILPTLNKKAMEHFGGTIDSHELTYFGICEKCMKEK